MLRKKCSYRKVIETYKKKTKIKEKIELKFAIKQKQGNIKLSAENTDIH